MATWDDVVQLGTRLPGVEVGSWYSTPGLKVRNKGMCRLRTSPDALVVRVTDLGEREVLLRSEPDVFFSTPHYEGSPHVLVRLEAIGLDELGELLEDAWRVFAGKRAVAAWDAGQAPGRTTPDS